MKIHPLTALKTNPFVLAPMAGITDHAYRTFMKKMGAGVVVSELVSATGIEYGSQRTLSLLSFDETQRPVGLQLFGESPEQIARAAQVVEQRGADFVDLNFGCPVPKVTKKGAGSAMLKDLPNMAKVLSATVKAVSIPVTIKIRTGWDANSLNAHDVAELAYNEGITWVAIHGRTRAQGYSGESNWDYIAEVKAKAKLPILGNGDILTAEQAVLRMKQTNCDGVLIGRGALKDPFIFMDSMSIWSGRGVDTSVQRDFRVIFLALHEELVKHCDDRLLQIQLKKFAAWFATGYPNAAQFRKEIFQSLTTAQVLECAVGYFSNLMSSGKFAEKQDTSREAFLMGGHG